MKNYFARICLLALLLASSSSASASRFVQSGNVGEWGKKPSKNSFSFKYVFYLIVLGYFWHITDFHYDTNFTTNSENGRQRREKNHSPVVNCPMPFYGYPGPVLNYPIPRRRRQTRQSLPEISHPSSFSLCVFPPLFPHQPGTLATFTTAATTTAPAGTRVPGSSATLDATPPGSWCSPP